jgi:hypothetical protein
MSDNSVSYDKKLLIITGPQGSGNHLFSRLLSLHPDVGGWKELHSEYWVPSDLETFAKYWVHPKQLSEFDFSKHDYWVANVSCPFMYDGVRYVPKIVEFAEECKKLNIQVTIGIIVRDQNINMEQQLRVRKEVTLPIAMDYYYEKLLPSEFPVHFIDHEAFFLHKKFYLQYLQRILKFPIAWDDTNIMRFIDEDANSKYVKYVDKHWLDEQVWNGIKSKKERGL